LHDVLRPIGRYDRRYPVDLVDAFARSRERVRVARHEARASLHAATSTTTKGSDE
jgi:hypothetical protein